VVGVSTKAAAAGRAPNRPSVEPATNPAAVRNVALIGHSGVGKTILVEHLLAFAGALSRAGSIPDGSTFSDSDPVEVAQQRSVFLTACPLRWKQTLINLLDTPGFADFSGELRAGLRACDAALFVVSAADPIDELTLALWAECEALTLPRAVVINRLDAPRADLAATLEACLEAFGGVGGRAVVPSHLPLPGNSALVSLLDTGVETFADERATLIEAIIAESEDETLLETYLEGGQIDEAVLLADLEAAVARGHLHPVVPIDAASDLGLAEVLDLIVAGFPPPIERPLPRAFTPIGADGPQLACDPAGPLVAQVVRTWVDPYVGRVSLARIFSGTIRADSLLHVSGHGGGERGHPDHDTDEKAATLLSASLAPVAQVAAGNLCVVARLSTAETGDTISERKQPLVVLAWDMPEPLLQVAIKAATRNDEDAMSKGLNRLSAADPSLRIERSTETGQLVLWCQGEAHADVVLARLRSGGAAVNVEPVRVSLRATLARAATGRGRHVKQSGGHGQFGVCTIEVEPLPRGSGIEFVDKVVGGVVPSQFISSVEKGVRAQLALGTIGGVPIVDVRVSLVDGKAHSVDSSDAAFQVAGQLAIKDCASEDNVDFLEPVDRVDITVSDHHIGAVLSDLSGRRGRVTGTERDTSGRLGSHSVIHAEVPAAELLRYAATLRSITGGAGTFTRAYLRHDPATPNVAKSLLAS
jgi:elongation factor G